MSDKTKLVIVESPAKARTLSGMLDNSFILSASMGHIRDLPENRLGIDIKNNFIPQYIITKKKEVNSLKNYAKNAKEIYLATDPDREGEAIAWHLKELLAKKTNGEFNRVVFHEITKTAIEKAFENPRGIDNNLVNSQQARRILDRLVGYQVSPLLWSNIKKNISAGRVQSVALRIICEREREIENFNPQEYWNLEAQFSLEEKQQYKYEGKLVRLNDKKLEIYSEQEAQKAADEIENAKNYYINEIKKEDVKKNPLPPLVTSTLQQTAGTYLKFSPSKTMQIAQQLYEGIQQEDGETVGLITYMRTDSFNLSQDAINMGRNYIENVYGKESLPKKPNQFKNSSNAQEAHEAIRPTNLRYTPEVVSKTLNKDQLNLYKLIWARFIASQMIPARYKRTTIDTNATSKYDNIYTFRTTSTVRTIDGFIQAVKNFSKEKSENEPKYITEIEEGQNCLLEKLDKNQKFTEPPPRFSEPSLIKELEANGIGRPSTYATIVNTIQKRKYVKKEKGKLMPQELGFQVNDYLVSNLPELFNVNFTADMENRLDNIERGKEHWKDMLSKFYKMLAQWVEKVKYKSAPDTDKVNKLFELLDKISQWEPPKKDGKKTYDDKKFVESLRNQFDKNGKLSQKQWQSLLSVALKYKNQIPSLMEVAANYSFKNELEELERIREDEINKLNKNTSQVTNALEKLKEINFTELVNDTKTGSFSEKEFLNSLIKRARENKGFTYKQKEVLKNIIIKHKEELSEFQNIITNLGVSSEELDKIKQGKVQDDEKNNEIKKLLAELENVSEWGTSSSKKGGNSNDKDFYVSLKKQFNQKGRLTNRQYYALKKLVSKYNKNI